MYYLYDGTFIGFLTLVYEVFLNKNFDIFIIKDKNTLFPYEIICNSENKAQKVYFKLKKIIGESLIEKIYIALLSNENGIELILLNYIKSALKYGKDIENQFLPEVKKLDDIFRRVNMEAHKWKGLLRFRKLKDNNYFAIIKPDNDVLSIIKEHFEDRFADQNFVIYDEVRKKALMYDSITKFGKIILLSEVDIKLLDYKNIELLHIEEVEYISLWQTYFKSIAIADRSNSALQKSHMPNKYWDNLVEIQY